MNIPYIMKRCSKCGEWKVASTVNFHRSKKGRFGLESQCKECRNKKSKQWREANREKVAEYSKQYYQDNKEMIKQYYEANKERIAEHQKQYRENNKEKIAEQRKQYYQDNKEKIKQYRENNKEKIAEQRKQYCEINKDKKREYDKQYYQDNKEMRLDRVKQWYKTPQGQVARFNYHNKRRTKEEQQGTGITKDQWLEMMQYFDWKCAYSGETLSKDNRSTDHIVPISVGGDNMIWNMVPMLRSLNSSKQDKDMLEWYREQSFYSEARLQKIYDWQEYAYNKYGKDSEYFNTNDIQIKLI